MGFILLGCVNVEIIFSENTLERCHIWDVMLWRVGVLLRIMIFYLWCFYFCQGNDCFLNFSLLLWIFNRYRNFVDLIFFFGMDSKFSTFDPKILQKYIHLLTSLRRLLRINQCMYLSHSNIKSTFSLQYFIKRLLAWTFCFNFYCRNIPLNSV